MDDTSDQDPGVPSPAEIDRVIAEVTAGLSDEARRRYGDNHVRAAVFVINGLAQYEEEHGPAVSGRAFTIGDARNYIATVRWQFAKTMPQWPHEYTVRSWHPELEDTFVSFAALIRRDGQRKPWPKDSDSPRYYHAYLVIDGWQYWTMGAPLEETTVINRARVESPGAA